MDILYNPVVFLPATALLVAILLVWAQLWAHTHEMYKPRGSSKEIGKEIGREFTVGLGFIWTFLAILFALAAFVVAIYVGINAVAVGLFFTSFLMAVTNIVQSLVMTLIKLDKGMSLTEPATEVAERSEKRCWFLVFLVAIVGLGLFSFSITGALWSCWGCIGFVVALAAGIYLFIKIIKGMQKRG